MWIYTAIIVTMLTYRAMEWWAKSPQVIAKLKLSQIQRSACLSITGAMWSTSTLAMKITLNLFPLDIYIREMA